MMKQGRELKIKIKLIYFFKNKKVGSILIEDIYKINKQINCPKIFGTSSMKHPGVNLFINSNEWFVGGKVSLSNARSKDIEINELKPSEVKQIFKKKNGKQLLVFKQEIFLTELTNIYTGLLWSLLMVCI